MISSVLQYKLFDFKGNGICAYFPYNTNFWIGLAHVPLPIGLAHATWISPCIYSSFLCWNLVMCCSIMSFETAMSWFLSYRFEENASGFKGDVGRSGIYVRQSISQLLLLLEIYLNLLSIVWFKGNEICGILFMQSWYVPSYYSFFLCLKSDTGFEEIVGCFKGDAEKLFKYVFKVWYTLGRVYGSYY